MTWSYIIHFGIISSALLLASFLRTKIAILKKYLIPSSILGGFFVFFFYNYFAKNFGLNTLFLEELIYHLLNISFIAMMLRPEITDKKIKNKNAVSKNVTAIILQYGFQTTAGLLFVLALFYTIKPDIFLAMGLNLALGFELGPGQAYSVTKIWEGMGFTNGGSFALAMSATGFIIGSIGGVILINIGVKQKWFNADKVKYTEEIKKKKIEESSELYSLDALTYHFALVFGTYLLSYVGLSFISYLLAFIGPLGVEFADSLWGVNFIFSSLTALVVKKFCKNLNLLPDMSENIFSRISGLSVDFTVAASLGAISVVAISTYWLELISLSIIGIIITVIILPWYCSRLFKDENAFERTILLYGTATGTLPTGLSLLRIVDPEFETPAATDYMYASGVVFGLVIPLILAINLPAAAYVEGSLTKFFAMLAFCALYLVVATLFYIKLAKKNAFLNSKKLWLTK